MDKPGKQLALILASPMMQQTFSAMKEANGELTRDIQEKLQIFSEYYSVLYASRDRQGNGRAFFLGISFTVTVN